MFLLEYYGYMRSNKDLVENANAALDMVLLTLKVRVRNIRLYRRG